jgi:hypothetical protein
MIVRKVFEMNVKMVLENNHWDLGYRETFKVKNYPKVDLRLQAIVFRPITNAQPSKFIYYHKLYNI